MRRRMRQMWSNDQLWQRRARCHEGHMSTTDGRHSYGSKVAPAVRGRRLTTIADHNEGGQQPTRADREEAQSQASDRNRQRERTLQAEGHERPRARDVEMTRA